MSKPNPPKLHVLAKKLAGFVACGAQVFLNRLLNYRRWEVLATKIWVSCRHFRVAAAWDNYCALEGGVALGDGGNWFQMVAFTESRKLAAGWQTKPLCNLRPVKHKKMLVSNTDAAALESELC